MVHCVRAKLLTDIRALLTLESTKMIALRIVATRLDYCNNSRSSMTSSDNFRSCRWQDCTGQSCMSSYTTTRCSATELRRQLHCHQWSNVSTTSWQFWLTRRGRAEVRRMAWWHLSLVTMCHLVHWDRRTNCCLAVLTRLSSWLTRRFGRPFVKRFALCYRSVLLSVCLY